MLKKKICQDCQTSSFYHAQIWLEEIINLLTPSWFFPLNRNLGNYLEIFLEKLLLFSKLASFKEDFALSDFHLRIVCFINEARKRGIKFRAFYGPFGYTNYFQAEINKKIIRFNGLPIADFANKYSSQFIDDKGWVKRELKKGNFPVANGRTFWVWQKKQAVKFGVNQLGFPLVIKPRSGSLNRHVTINIQNIESLKRAINKAIIYSPCFIIEKFIPHTFVHRATVVDFNFVACVKQIPANVVGNSRTTIRELIDKKNNDPRRGNPHQEGFTLHKIVENEVTKKLLEKRGYNYSTILKKDEILFLQKEDFLKLGGDLIEITPQTHPDNIQLFRDITKFFGIRITGIDFLAQTLSISWKKQPCAVLELNSLPCIDLHHFPMSGKPQNVAKELVNMFFKYYL